MDDPYANRLTAAALGMGVLLSPDTMVLLGNVMGRTGGVGLGILAAAMVLFALLSPLMKGGAGAGGYFSFVPLIVKGATAVFLSTGILVSSGFVFNEVFVYWFPNFGFAFLLLAAVLGTQLAGPRVVFRAQVFFAGAALACFIALILSGLGRIAPPPVSPGIPSLGDACLPLLLWVGFDLAWSAPQKRETGTPVVPVIILAGCLFLSWGFMSIVHVPLEKLSDTGIPHMKTARALLGDTGRFLMGAAVILGTLAAVNALFTAVNAAGTRLADAGLMPRWAGNRFLAPLILAAGIGTMMATGMAGSDRLEIWIRAAFLLWLMTYVVYSVSALTRKPSKTGSVLAVLLGAGWVCLVIYGGAERLLYMTAILGAGLAPGVISVLRSNNRKDA